MKRSLLICEFERDKNQTALLKGLYTFYGICLLRERAVSMDSIHAQARRLGGGGGGGRWVRSTPPRSSELVPLAIKIIYSLLLYMYS